MVRPLVTPSRTARIAFSGRIARLGAALATSLYLSSWSSVSFADQTRDRAAARTAADAGADAFEEGKYDQAFELFSRAEALFHAPPHLLFIARSLEKRGKLIEARENYLKLVNEKLPPGASRAFKEAQKAGEQELNAIESRLAYVTLKIQGNPDGAIVSMDGAELPAAMVGIPVPVDPGTHAFSASKEGARSPEVSVTLAEGAKETVELKLNEASAVPESQPEKGSAASGTSTQVAGESAASTGSTQRVLGFVTLGVGVVAAGVGTGFMVSSLNSRSKATELYDVCNPSPTACTGPEQDQIDGWDADADRAQWFAVGGFAVGGAAIITGIWLVATAGPAEVEARARPPARTVRFVAGPSWLGAAGTF